MSAHRFLAILILAPALAAAAESKAVEKPATEKTATEPEKPQKTTTAESEELRREVDAKVEAAKKELREEIRAQAATQSAAQGWQEEWVDEKRKLELLTMDGYFRVRPDLFHNFDLRRTADPAGFTLFPASPASSLEHTIAGVNMRVRLEPTINVSEQVRLRLQIDGLDNVVMGSTPDYAFSRSERADIPLLSESQVPPVSGLNAVKDSITLKRVFGEVKTPVGMFRFGRMGSQWGLGMVHNDGSCFDCDFGDTVDRIMLVAQPPWLPDIYVAPMIDFNVEGPTSTRFGELGQPVDLSQSDDAHSYVLVIAKRDTDQQTRSKLESGQAILNGGVHFTYRTQHADPIKWFNSAFTTEGGDNTSTTDFGYTVRNSWLVIPDLWGKYEQKAFRIEVEAAARIGSVGSASGLHGLPDTQTPLSILEMGAVAQGEYRLMDGKLKLRGELGWASGDKSPGMGANPGRSDKNNTAFPGFPQVGDIDGPQWRCPTTGGCNAPDSGQDPNIRNFTFNRDYRIDLILWRELIGTITDAIYAKPSLDYELADGLHLQGALIYSRAVYAESTPAFDPTGSSNDPGLGVEIDGGLSYETEDGFYAH
ncbi:MAG TPA: TIGR04551 family protein, partial [Myxococcales bacterium]|nr:TIGR04551 family protein [Myxococcales bacterium]